MTTIRAHFDGKTFVPDEAVNLPVGAPLTLYVERRADGDLQAEAQLKALDELLDLSGVGPGNADWSRESIYSGTLDDPR
jgi:hypothetical protein